MQLYHPTNPGLVDPEAARGLMQREAKPTKGGIPTLAPDLKYNPKFIQDNPLPYVGEKKTPAFITEVVPAAFKANNLMYGIGSRVTDATYDPVPGYDARKDEAAYADIPEDYHDQFFDSTSPAETLAIRNRVVDQLEYQQTLAEAGWAGTAAGLVASFADPLVLAGGAGVWSAGFKALRTASRLKNVAAGSGIGVAEAAAYNELSLSTHQMTANDQAMNIALGAAGGVLAGSLIAPARTAANERALSESAAKVLAGRGESLDGFAPMSKAEFKQLRKDAKTSPEAQAALDDYLLKELAATSTRSTEFSDDLIADSASLMRHAEDLLVKTAGDLTNPAPASYKAVDDNMPAAADLGGRKSVGAAGAPNRYAPREGFQPLSEKGKQYDSYAQERAAELAARADSVGEKTAPLGNLTPYSRQLLETGAPAARAFVGDMLEVPAGAVSNETAAIHRSTLVNKYDTAGLFNYQRGFQQHFKNLRKSDNTATMVKKWGNGTYRKDYDRLVYQEMLARDDAFRRGVTHRSTAPDYIRKAADGIDDNMRKAREDMINYGLVSDSLPEHPGYIPRKWDWEKIAQMTPAMRQEFTDLLARAYAATGIPSGVADKIARNMVVRATSNEGQIDANIFNQMDAKSTAELADFLTQAGVNADEITDLMDLIHKRNAARSAPGMLKTRTDIDLTTASQNFALMDFVDTNIERLVRTYNVETSGRVALAAKGIYSKADWDDMTAVIVNDVHRSNPNVSIEDTMLALNDTWEAFTGSAVRGGINKQAGRLMAATQIAMLAGSGLAQLGEFSTVMARHMVNGGMRNIPMIGEMATLARTNPDSPLLKSIAAAGGPLWDNMLLHSPDIRLDWEGTVSNRAGKTIDRVLAIGQGWMSTVSGLRLITSYQRRLASVLESDALVRMAHDGLPTDAKALRRLEAMGLSFGSGGNWDSIADALRAHSKFDQRGVLTDIDFDAMPEGTRNDLLFIIKRSVGQQIQESFIGETPTAMNSTIGKMFGQFRSYPLLAMDKQASRQFAIGDTEAYVSVMMGLLVNAMIAPARMAGRSEDINAGTIAAQAIQYLPYSGLLPDALNVLAAVGIVPDSMALMNWGQEQERNVSLVDTVAPVSLQYGYKLLRAPEIIGERASPWTEKDELSASDIRALRGAAPLGSLPGIGQLTSAMFAPNQ